MLLSNRLYWAGGFGPWDGYPGLETQCSLGETFPTLDRTIASCHLLRREDRQAFSFPAWRNSHCPLVCFLMKIGSFFRNLFLVNFLYLEAVVCPHLRPLLCRHRRGLPQQQVTSGHSLFFVPDGLAAGAAEITRAHGGKDFKSGTSSASTSCHFWCVT